MEDAHLSPSRSEEEIQAPPRFDTPAAAVPKRVVPLERIRARTASAFKRVRVKIQPAAQPSWSQWLPMVVLVIVAGVVSGFFLTMYSNSEPAEDAPVVRSELEASTDKSNVQTKKSSFMEKENAAARSNNQSLTADAEEADSNTDSMTETGAAEIPNKEENLPKSLEEDAPPNSDRRLEMIQQDAERQAERERRKEDKRFEREERKEEKRGEKAVRDAERIEKENRGGN